MTNKSEKNLIRTSILLLILPILYIILWMSISDNEAMTYSDKVMTLMGYLPEFARNPFWIAVTFFGMSFVSAFFSFMVWLRSSVKGVRILSFMICILGVGLTILFGAVLF